MIDYKALYAQTKTLSVLLVEDHKEVRHAMIEVLEDLFSLVIPAKDGVEAWEYYRHRHTENQKGFDLIISDIQMPNMDGITLSKKVREINEHQPILILSAYKDSEYLLELINIGVSKFITKPIDYDTFLSLLLEESKKIHLANPKNEVSNVVHLAKEYYWHKDIRILKQNETIIELTKHELLLLEFFILKKEYLCSSQDIIETFYKHGIEISVRNIRNLIFKLRQKIPQECIQSVYGLGYKFIPQASIQ